MKNNPTGRYLTPHDIAKTLQIGHIYVLDLIHAGAFPNVVNVGGEGRGARYRIPPTDLELFIKARRVVTR